MDNLNLHDLEEQGFKIEDFYNIDTLIDYYEEYTDSLTGKKIEFGFPQLDGLIRGLRSQEVLTVIAQTGIGKSALALNLLHNFVKQTHEITILFSLEMSAVGIAERIFQIELDVFGFDVERKFKNKERDFIDRCRGLQASLNNFYIVTKRIDVSSIPKYVKLFEAVKRQKVRLVCIDYVGLMENKLFPKEEYFRITDNMRKLYAYAKELDVALINLSQVSRQDIKSNEALSLFSGKGSGEVENSSDFVFALEPLKVNEKTDQKLIDLENSFSGSDYKLLNLNLLKNRRGAVGNILLLFNKRNLRISEYLKP